MCFVLHRPLSNLTTLFPAKHYQRLHQLLISMYVFYCSLKMQHLTNESSNTVI